MEVPVSLQTSHIHVLWLQLRYKKSLLKANFLHLKVLEIVREHPDHTGSESNHRKLWDIIKTNINAEYMLPVMNIVIMYHVHQLSTQMEGKSLQVVPKSTPINNKQASPTI